jgi:two-component system, NtrC family, sensor kinase
MKLAVKLSSALVLGIVAVMSVYAAVQISNEVMLSEADAQRARRNGLAWLGAIESVWAREGEPRARELIELSALRSGTAEGFLRVVRLAPDAPDRPALSPDELRAVESGEVVRRVLPDAEGHPWQHGWVALRTAKQPTAIEIVEPLAEERAFVRMSHVAIVGATVAVIAICALLAILLEVRLVGRPLALLRDKARRAGAGDFSTPLVLLQHDEMGELAAEINAMCDRIAEANHRAADETAARIAALEQLRHSERLATVGQLAAGVAHEIGTPLNVVSARAELLVAGGVAASDVVGNGRIILEQADRMTRIVQQLLDFSRRRGPEMGLANLEQVVRRTLDLISPAAERAHVRVECAASGPIFARLDQGQIQQVLANVLMNGIQAMPGGGRLRVGLGVRRARRPAAAAAEADYLCVTVDDEGCGIARENLPRVFEPFFTTKGLGEGTGLGLAVAHGIIAEHGGWIEVESEVGKGSRFSIFLPRPAEPVEAAS